MSRKWLFVDEEAVIARKCAEMLSEPGQFDVHTVEPAVDVTFLREALKNEAFDGLLLDHALNDAKSVINYSGSTLAAFIRNEFEDLPIVVLSARLSDRAELRRYRRTEDLFDLKLDKQDLQLNAEGIRKRLESLGDGYKALKKVFSTSKPSDYNAACRVLNVSYDIEDDSERSMIARLILETGGGDPPRVAHFLLQVALRLPGPLLDRDRAAVGAGLSPGSNRRIDEYIAPAAYSGVFAGTGERGRWYWRELLSELSGDRGDLAPSFCIACKEEAFEVCEVCGKPVDGLHSLPALRNEVANDIFLRGRICGFCLAGDEEIPRGLSVDSSYAKMREALVAEVQDLQKARLLPDSPTNARRS